MPNAEAIVRIAKKLAVSIDFLLIDDFQDKHATHAVAHDFELADKFRALESMPDKDREIIISLIDAYIKKQQIERIMQS